MAAKRRADAAFGVREIDEQRVGCDPRDVTRDPRNQWDRPQGVRQTAGARVLAEHMFDAVTARSYHNAGVLTGGNIQLHKGE